MSSVLHRLSITVLLSIVLATFTVFTGVFSVTPSLHPPRAHADQARAEQWQVEFLHAQKAWKHAQGEGVVVAVLDSGVDASHEDLKGQILAGADYVDGSTSGRSDSVGHGTAVAGLIAGRRDDDNGVLGIAPKAHILPVRVLDKNNEYDSASEVADAVRWATDHGADVINLSLGSANTSRVLSDALRYALSNDVVVIACNGNYSNERGTEVWHPAREPGVIAVSGVGRNAEFWSGSLYGDATVLAAPAANLTIATPGGGTRSGSYGTSYAAPLVSAAAALLRSAYPTMSAANIINRLISTAWDFGTPGVDDQFGYGIVNPAAAISSSVDRVDHNPLLPKDSLPQPSNSDASSSPNAGTGEHDAQNRADDDTLLTPAVVWGGCGVLIIGTVSVMIWVRTRRRSAVSGTPYEHTLSAPTPLDPSLSPPSGVPPDESDQATVMLREDDQTTLHLH